MRDLSRWVRVDEAARAVHRSPSTIHGWLAAGKVHRKDRGGRGVPALVELREVYVAERDVRGKGRPPVDRR
jgi:hypothetical protein